MSEFRIDQIKSQDATRGPDVAGITTFTGTSGIVMPSGDTAYRGGRGRGVFGGGYDTGSPYAGQQVLDYVTIATLGNSTDFGDLSVPRSAKPGGSSSTRGLFISGRFTPTADYYNIIDYITISSTGNAFDFGDLVHSFNPDQKASSNQVRGVYGGGYFDYASAGSKPNLWLGDIGYYTIATTGNSSGFGELLTKGRRAHTGSNGIRGIWGSVRGGTPGVANVWINCIEYVNIMTTGNAQDFGDMTVARSNTAGSATSKTRMVMHGGVTSPSSWSNVIDYITMASKGNAQDFGDTGEGQQGSACTCSTTRGVFQPGSPGSTPINILEYITIATTGNSQDFGDLSFGRRTYGTVSDSHGGLE